MGQKKRRLDKFIQSHPFCCLCGGEQATETIEHAPPKAMFVDSHRPKGLEVPACERCNKGSSQHDQVASAISFTQSPKLIFNPEVNPSEFQQAAKLIDGAGNNALGDGPLFHKIGKVWVRDGVGYKMLHKLRLADRTYTKFLNVWAGKQTLALWYSKTGRPMSSNGEVRVFWFSPENLAKSEEVMSALSGLPSLAKLEQGSWDTGDQFACRYVIADDRSHGAFWFTFHKNTMFISMLIDNPPVEFDEYKATRSGSATIKTNRDKGMHQTSC